MKKDRKKIFYLVLAILITILYVSSFGRISYHVLKINILPSKFLLAFFIGSLVFFFLMCYLLFSKRKIIFKIIIMMLATILSIGMLVGTKYLMNTYAFFENTNVLYDTLSYSVLVTKKSPVKTIEDLKEKNILYLQDDYQNDIKKELEQKITYHEKIHNEFGTVIDQLVYEKADAIVLEESYISLAKEEIEAFDENTKVIYSFKIQVKAHEERKEEEEKINVVLNPFILYISGIDQYGDLTSVRGRSDVNQIVVINPLTHHLLLVNTPRDYYVQIAGTTGLKDKLTHAGIYGIEKSIRTLENLYEIDINHYLRVNFNTVIKLVDVIGGIDIESDKAFQAWTNKKVYVQKGWNHFNGDQALAYARERMTYTTGDHHRGANQQQVMTAIINKVTNSKVLISKYNSILTTLNGSFQTDMPMDEITSFIKYQIDKMPSWKIESIAVTGSGSMEPTYSMGSKLKLYVMKPNMESVKKVQQKINEVLSES